MKKSLFAGTLAAVSIAAATAVAADLPGGPTPYYSAPAVSGLYNWSGPYAGLNVGYEWGRITNTAGSPSGLAGGGQVGYNYQRSCFVYGIETDFDVNGMLAPGIAFR